MERMGVRKNGGRGPSIYDVAKGAGVSVATVSRYLNEKERVSPARQEKIRAAIDELGYRPSAVAQAFSRGSSRCITVVVSSLRLFGPTLTVAGIEERAAVHGYAVDILTLDSESRCGARSTAFVDRLWARSPEGILLIEYDERGKSVAAEIPGEIPCVGLCEDGVSRGHRQVSLATFTGGKAVTGYLLSLGHKTVYHVSVPFTEAGAGRERGWRAALEKSGAVVPDPIEASWSPQSGVLAGKRLASIDDCTAVFVGNDEVAMGVIAGLTAEGKRVPEDVSVIGMDGHPLGCACIPPLTTYRLGFEEAGAAAFDMLASGNNRADALLLEFEGELIVRDSASAPPRQ